MQYKRYRVIIQKGHRFRLSSVLAPLILFSKWADPTAKQTTAIQETLAKLVREEVFPRTTARAILPKEISITRAYFPTRIHKPENPLTMNESLMESTPCELLKWMFGHLIVRSEHNIHDSRQFLESIKRTNIAPDECMISFDVVSPSTNISLELALEMIVNLLENYINLSKNNYNYYTTTSSAATSHLGHC